MPMLTTDTVDTTAVDTDTVDTTDTLTDTDTVDTTAVDTTGVELLLKQTNKPLKLQLSGSSHSKFVQFGYNAKTPSPLIFFLKHENSLFFPIELESKSNVYNLKSL